MPIEIKCKKVVSPAEMTGGEKEIFYGVETVGTPGGETAVQFSEPRPCIKMEKEISGKFHWKNKISGNRRIFRIRGMWDTYKYLPVEASSMGRFIEQRTNFAVVLNDKDVFRGVIHFCHYRQWRFWTAMDIPLPENAFHTGENTFKIINLNSEFKLNSANARFPESILKNSSFQVSDVAVIDLNLTFNDYLADFPKDIYIGHIVNGHKVYHIPTPEWWQLNIDLFRAMEQGNLMVFLPHRIFGGALIDWDKINLDKIEDNGLHIGFRCEELKYPGIDIAIYEKKLRNFIKRAKKILVGFGPHEHHALMSNVLKKHPEEKLSGICELFKKSYIGGPFKAIKNLDASALLWDTDPSFYSRYYLMAGADIPATELCVNNASLDIASTRGACLGFKRKTWVCINSFECQTFGGLMMREHHAAYDKHFEKKRENLWRLMQYSAYLGGARIIYTESGVFDHKITIKREFDSPHLQKLQDIQKNFIDFVKQYPFKEQPLCGFAYLQGKNDISKPSVVPEISKACGNADFSWNLLEALFVNFRFEERHKHSGSWFLERYHPRELISDTPYGDADILPIESEEKIMKNYKLLIMGGWNTLDKDNYQKLFNYVKNGGTLFLLAPQLTETEDINNPTTNLNKEWLAELCGVTHEPHSPGDVPINRLCINNSHRKKFRNVFRILEKLPKTHYFRVPVYDSECKQLSIYGKNSETIIYEKNSGFPFLTRNRIGKGYCYLGNIARYTSTCLVYKIISAAIRDVVERNIPREIALESGKCLNYYIYRKGKQKSTIFILSNDWYSGNKSRKGCINIFGRKINFSVSPEKLCIIHVSGNRIPNINYISV